MSEYLKFCNIHKLTNTKLLTVQKDKIIVMDKFRGFVINTCFCYISCNKQIGDSSAYRYRLVCII